MLILWRLLFGHFLADFTLQTNFINDWKRSSHWGMVAHCAMHPLCYLALTYPFVNEYWVVNPLFQLKGWACILFIFVAHYIEDQWRVFTIFRYRTPDNTLYFIWDQVIHYAVIFAVIPASLMAGSQFDLVPEKWPVLGILAVIVTYFSTVLIYFIEKDLYKKDFPATWDKYMGMALRMLIALCCFFPEPAAAGVAAATAAGLVLVLRQRRIIGGTKLGLALGIGIAAACGALGRWIFYN